MFRYIIIDEAHMYRGIFGSHVACILRRLFRLCYLYGSNPQVIACSASIRNAAEHFHLLVPNLEKVRNSARPLTVISKDGSPTGKKLFVVWNPSVAFNMRSTIPTVNNSKQADATESTIYQTAQLLTLLVLENIHTIVFCKVSLS